MWDLMVQTMDPEQEDSLDFDPLDSTKLWPEARIFCFMCVFSLFRILEMYRLRNSIKHLFKTCSHVMLALTTHH